MIAIGQPFSLPRIYPILDTGALARLGFDTVSAAEALIEGGARILQYRHKGPYKRIDFERAARVRELCGRDGVKFVIDDRADIAILLDAGLHVGQDDLEPADARRLIGRERLLGLSTHSLRQLCAALKEPVEYLAYGPVFATRSKENPDMVVGLEGLREACRTAGGRPVVAIGGIARASARQVFEAGAASIAVIRDILPEPCSFEALRVRMEEWQNLAKT